MLRAHHIEKDRSMKLFAVKIAIAVVAIGCLVLVAASQLAPGLAAWKVLLGAAMFALVLMLAVLAYALVSGSLKQLLLRWGAIDTQWLWAPDYPKGFKRHFRSRPETGDE
jgi:hypothetical protein